MRKDYPKPQKIKWMEVLEQQNNVCKSRVFLTAEFPINFKFGSSKSKKFLCFPLFLTKALTFCNP